MINWKPISEFIKPNYNDPNYGECWLVCKDCGDGSLKIVSIGRYNLQIDGWVFNDTDSSYTMRERGYRVTHFAEIQNYPS